MCCLLRGRRWKQRTISFLLSFFFPPRWAFFFLAWLVEGGGPGALPESGPGVESLSASRRESMMDLNGSPLAEKQYRRD